MLIQFCLCKTSCLKVVQFSALATCQFELLSVRVRVRWRVPGAGPRRAFFSLVLSFPLQFLLTIAHNCCPQVLCAISRCSLVRLEESASRCAPQPLAATPSKPLRWRVPSRVANLYRWSLHCSLAFHSAFCNLLTPSSRITLFSDWFLGKHSAW